MADRGRGGGLGNPFEEEYAFEGWRDYGQGEPRPKDVVSDPARKATVDDPKEQAKLDNFFDRFRDELRGPTEGRPLIFFSKRPSFVEPPFFSKPLMKTKCGLAVAPGATASIFDYPVEDRQRIMTTAIGVEVAPLAPLLNCQLEFWFSQGQNINSISDIIPVFDDQTPTSYGGSTPVVRGKTTVIPGSVEVPYCLLSNGLAFGIRGPKRFTFNVQNKSGVTVVIRGLLGFYQYWAGGKKGAAEFEDVDLQL